jgi:DNA polymerase V
MGCCHTYYHGYAGGQKMYALVDCHNFYCSCERVFNPGLKGRPVIVLSNNDGCAIARSEEAKILGISMAQPVFMIQHLIDKHNVAVFSSNYTLYGDMSNRIMETLTSFVPAIERYSIDEAFLDLREFLHTDLFALAIDIQKTIRKNIGIPVSIGMAPTKTLAKMANRYAKKFQGDRSVFCANSAELIGKMLENTSISEIWGIGNQHTLLLSRAGFKTAADLIKAPDDWVQKHLAVVGLRLVYELRGIASIPFELHSSARKNICTSRSFGSRMGDQQGIAEALANHAARCAAKLRDDGSCCSRIQVFIQTNPHKTDEPQYCRSIDMDLERASNHSGEIIKAALNGLELIYRPGFQYMKCGITVMELVPASAVQSSFFDQADGVKNNRLMKVLDRINDDLRGDHVRIATQGFERKYRLKTAFLSRRYTTRMNEILQIRN